MARSHFFVDRAVIVRPEVEISRGARSAPTDVEYGDWIPCRLREPSGDTDFLQARHELQPTHTLHFAPRDNSGVLVDMRPSDRLRIYQRLDDMWVPNGADFRIIGVIQPKRRRTRLVSYTVDLYAPEVEH